ncbi:isoprenyl transferase [Caenispirillum bisanense]|uniref:Isoprenyl transferase n=1 Tax=Caenispirillum bisanense TaxID=414052 RepID=A0A286H1P2_9PROT|nr:isoprenyl transferase [Caenispirillum bisanense]SOE01632.1 Undecaprenyl pyrophosphate synthetase [Caenispirillum bisanense]
MGAEPLPSRGDAPPMPVHVAIIMDGNGRWARARGLPRTAGHRQGAEAVRRVVRAAGEMGIGTLTLFAFSSENWRRPEDEVTELRGLLRLYLRNEIGELHANGVRLRVIGDRDQFGPETVRLIEQAEALTAGNGGLQLVIALSYGGRAEIAAAARRLAEEAKAGLIDPSAIDEDAVTARLFTADIPDPDLLIRTSGEQRVSNFLLWQIAYAEMVFSDTLWPDFDRADLEAAVAAFRGRERRYGGVTD